MTQSKAEAKATSKVKKEPVLIKPPKEDRIMAMYVHRNTADHNSVITSKLGDGIMSMHCSLAQVERCVLT